MAVKKKKIKTGGMTLEEAKRKINDPNYNVMSGRIEKDKNVQTGPNKRRITKEDMMNIGMGVLPFSRIPKFLSRIPQMLKPSQRFQKLVTNTQRTKTQPLPKPRPKSLRSTAVTKPRATQLKKPSTAVTSRSNVSRMSPTNAKRFQQMVNRAVLTSGISELVKPKKSVADTKPKTKKTKGVITGPELNLPKKKKESKVAPKKAPVKKKRSNIVGSSTYDAQFTYDNLVKRGGKKFAKARMSPENYAKVKKKAGGGAMKKTMKMTGGGSLKAVPEGNKGKGLSKLPTEVRNKMGYMKKGGKLTSNKAKINKVTTGLRKAVKAHTGQAKMLSSIKLNKGGKVIKMRGGGAATKGLRFNRGY
tara:strand:- start:190 stop:1266 length:1077 start_codon:yes stop_codon:yes gene_type:complete